MRPSRYAFPAALLCAAGLSIGLCFCVITSFAVPVDPVRLLLACFLAAALFSAVFLLKKSWILPLHWMAKKHISMPIS